MIEIAGGIILGLFGFIVIYKYWRMLLKVAAIAVWIVACIIAYYVGPIFSFTMDSKVIGDVTVGNVTAVVVVVVCLVLLCGAVEVFEHWWRYERPSWLGNKPPKRLSVDEIVQKIVRESESAVQASVDRIQNRYAKADRLNEEEGRKP